ncbi:hypothetical protein pb186bvf_010394 [Paramecium bursaria]
MTRNRSVSPFLVKQTQKKRQRFSLQKYILPQGLAKYYAECFPKEYIVNSTNNRINDYREFKEITRNRCHVKKQTNIYEDYEEGHTNFIDSEASFFQSCSSENDENIDINYDSKKQEQLSFYASSFRRRKEGIFEQPKQNKKEFT